MQVSHSLINLLAIVCCLAVAKGSIKDCPRQLSNGECRFLKELCSEGNTVRVAFMIRDKSSHCQAVAGTSCEFSSGPYCKSNGGNGHETTGETEIPRSCQLSSAECHRYKMLCSMGIRGGAGKAFPRPSHCKDLSGTYCELSNGPQCKWSTGNTGVTRGCQLSNAECQRYKMLCSMGIMGGAGKAFPKPSPCKDISGTYCELSSGPQCKWSAGNTGVTRGCHPSNAQCQRYKKLCSMGIGGIAGMAFSRPSPCKDFSGTYCEIGNGPQCKWSTGNAGVTRGCHPSNAECQEYKKLCSKGIGGRVAMTFSKPSPCNDYSGTYCELSNGPQCKWGTGIDRKMTRGLEE